MKNSTFLRVSLFATAALIGAVVWAADKTESRPAPKFSLDAKPINRDATERVSYSSVVKKTAPSVVYVFSSKKIRAQNNNPFFDDPTFRRYFGIPDDDSGSGSKNRNRARPQEQTQTGLGSGIIVTSDGYILTNNHVVEGADEVKIAFGEPRKEFKATVVGRDAKADVAVVKIDATGLPAATLGDSDKLEIGDVVLAIGNPFGVGQSVSRGIVSALSRGGLGIETYEDFIQTDAAINPGNSGGALFDTDGRVVGINTAILSRTGGFNGIGFAIPINQARGLAEQLITKGKVERAYLGVETQALDEELSSMLKVKQGALINVVHAGTPAEKAGLKNGDVITKVDSTEVKDNRQLQLLITRIAPGTEVKIAYVREDKTATATAKLGTLTDQVFAGDDRAIGGKGNGEGVLNDVSIGELTAEVRQELSVPKRIEGVVVTGVQPGGTAARAGLREGDVIISLDRKTATNVEDAVKLSEEIKGPKVLVQVWRRGGVRTIVVDESEK
jgi:serine protease Do